LSQAKASAIFAERLKQARALRGLSQRALGDLLGLGKQVGSTRINRYEREVSQADMQTAADIARALDVPLAYLFADTDDLAEVILAFARMTLKDRSRVLALINERKPGSIK